MTLVSAVEVRAANSVELAQSDARLDKHQLELVERERDRLRTEATTAKAELLVDRSDRESFRSIPNPSWPRRRTYSRPCTWETRPSAERLRFAEYTNKVEK